MLKGVALQHQIAENAALNIRDPIKKSKAEIQTIYITTGYAWTQTTSSIIIHVNFQNANKVIESNCTLDVHQRDIEFNILNHAGANYKFRINQLYHPVLEGKFVLKFKENKIIIQLSKETQDVKWPDLRLKSTRAIYNRLERFEKQCTTTTQAMDTPFKEYFACAQHCGHNQ